MGVDSPIDVSSEQYETILTLLRKYLPETTAWVYGSRAKRTSRPHSDLDLVIFSEPGQHLQVGELREAFEESNLPFRVDLFVWDDVPDSFRENIREQHIELMLGHEEASEPVVSHPESDKEAGLLFGNCASLLSKSVNPASLSQSIPYIGLEHIVQEKLHLNGTGESTDVTSTKRRFVRGDILFGKLRPYFRKVVQPDFDGICSTDIWVIEPKENVDPRFLFYWCASWDFVDFLDASSEGTRMPRAKWGVAVNHCIPTFSTHEQKAIAHILGTLDDKIELNQKTNKTLEEIAKAIFKSWFVDFDPVRAKAEGRPTGLPPEISDLFPHELVDSEIGEIPKGWAVTQIGDLCEVIDCLHSKKPDLIEEGFNFIQLKEIGEDGLLYWDSISKISEESYKKWISRIEVCEGDCLITNVGRVGAFARIPAEFMGAIGRNITAVRPLKKATYGAFVADYFLSHLYESERELRTDTGTILDALNVKNIPNLRLVLPQVLLLEKYNDMSAMIWEKRELLVQENSFLAELRDTLLPKLISGELRIPDAEKFLEEAVT